MIRGAINVDTFIFTLANSNILTVQLLKTIVHLYSAPQPDRLQTSPAVLSIQHTITVSSYRFKLLKLAHHDLHDVYFYHKNVIWNNNKPTSVTINSNNGMYHHYVDYYK